MGLGGGGGGNNVPSSCVVMCCFVSLMCTNTRIRGSWEGWGGINVPSPCVVMCCFMSLMCTTTCIRSSGGYHTVSSCAMFYTYVTVTWVSRCNKFLYHVSYFRHLGITL